MTNNEKKVDIRLLLDLNLRGNVPLVFETNTLTTRSNSRRHDQHKISKVMHIH